MRIVHVKGKSVNVMENAMNAENIMPSLNVRGPLPVKKRRNDEILYKEEMICNQQNYFESFRWQKN